MPKLITSASESSSRPKSLAVLVSRRDAAVQAVEKTETPIALAAISKCGLNP